MKILRIGDPHIKPSNLEEAEKLMHFINDKIREIQPDRVEILGDLFHTHSIVRLEVMEFWQGWIDVLLSHETIDIYVLAGNHDRATTDEMSYSALSVFQLIRKKNLKIVELPRVDGIYAYVPHYHDQKKFVEIANNCADKYGAKVLVCHQTFDGSHYENGFYAPDGIDFTKLNFKTIISGHIHTRQVLKNIMTEQTVIYPGTPKWDTEADANQDKGVWLYEHDDVTGAVVSEELIRTAGVVTQIVSIVWKEGEPKLAIPSGCAVTIELVGSSAWVEQEKVALKGYVKIKTKITDRAKKADRQTGKSFEDFVKNLFVTTMDRDALLKTMKEMGIE